MSGWSLRAQSILRIITALLFMQHGLMKIFHFPIPHPDVPDPLPLMLQIAGWIEVVGGGLIAVGLLSRVAAFICSGEMAFAYFIAHAPISPWPARNEGDAAILMCFVFLYIAAAEPDPWSIDRRLRGPARSHAIPGG